MKLSKRRALAWLRAGMSPSPPISDGCRLLVLMVDPKREIHNENDPTHCNHEELRFFLRDNWHGRAFAAVSPVVVSTLHELHTVLAENPFDALHVIGDANGNGELLVEEPDNGHWGAACPSSSETQGHEIRWNAEQLFDRLKGRNRLDLVVLNYCHSLRAAEQISRLATYSIGNDNKIDHRVAPGFAKALYSAISGRKEPVAKAFEQAKKALEKEENELQISHAEPKLYLRAGLPRRPVGFGALAMVLFWTVSILGYCQRYEPHVTFDTTGYLKTRGIERRLACGLRSSILEVSLGSGVTLKGDPVPVGLSPARPMTITLKCGDRIMRGVMGKDAAGRDVNDVVLRDQPQASPSW